MADPRRTRPSLKALVGIALAAGALVTGCTSADDSPDEAGATASGSIELTFTQEPAPPDLAAQVLPPGNPTASWVDDSTLRVVWVGLLWCPASPVAISHDGAGAYSVELEYEPPPQGACDLAAEAVVTTFTGVPHADADSYTVVLHGPEDGQTVKVQVG